MPKAKETTDDQYQARGQLSTIDEKIAEVRNRRKKVRRFIWGNEEEICVLIQKTKAEPEREEEKPSVGSLEDESYEMEIEQEPVADRMKVKEAKKKKSGKNKQVKMTVS
jgi:hypothetical protein